MESTQTPPLSHAEQQRRREALAAAERSGIMEGLPPVSAAARALGERYARGEITADQAVAEVLAPYRAR
jgi:hypothetical protein